MSFRTKRKFLNIGASYVSAIIFLMVTNPKDLPSVALVIPFVLLFLALYFSAMVVLELSRSSQRQTIAGLPVVRPRVVACLIAGFPILLIVLQSIGQLTIRDVITASAIFVLAYFYVARFSTNFSGR